MTDTTDLASAQQRAAVIRQRLLATIEALSIDHLAGLIAAEGDDDVVVPEFRSPGQAFLLAARRQFVDWVRDNQQFPPAGEEALAATRWPLDATGTEVAQAFVDLGLHYSAHAQQANSAVCSELTWVMRRVADQFVVAMVEAYGPRS